LVSQTDAAAQVSKPDETTARQNGWFGSVSLSMHLGLELQGGFLDKKQKRSVAFDRQELEKTRYLRNDW
jgi:hypothetical protein